MCLLDALSMALLARLLYAFSLASFCGKVEKKMQGMV